MAPAQIPSGGRVLRIDHVQVGYTVDTDHGPQQATVSLEDILRHCRAERVEDLIEDFTVLIEDVLAGRQPDDHGRPSLALVRRVR